MVWFRFAGLFDMMPPADPQEVITAVPASSRHLMALLVTLFGLAAICFSDRMPVNNGMGFDGRVYGAIVKDLRHQVFDRQLDLRFIQRVLPCAVVHYMLRAVGISLQENVNIIHGFQAYNLLLLVIGAYLWSAIAGQLHLGRRGAWLGFVALFGNFAVLRLTFYYPVLTDTTAVVIGLVLVYGFLGRHSLLVMLAGLASAFSWPPALYMSALLLLFPRSAARPAVPFRPISFFLYAVPATVIVVVAAYLFYVKHVILASHVAQTWRATAPLAIGIVFVFLAVAVRWLIDQDILTRLVHGYREMSFRPLIMTATMFALAKLALHFWLIPRFESAAASITFVVQAEFVSSIAKPAVFLVAHVVYYGPIILVAIFFWPSITANLRSLGLGAVLTALLGLVQGVTSESRHLLAFLPLLVALAAQAMERARLPRGHDIVFVLTTLVASKFWMPMTVVSHGPFDAFPSQSYLMNQGPWMSNLSYAIQSAAVLVLLAIFGWYYRRKIEEWPGAIDDSPLPPGS